MVNAPAIAYFFVGVNKVEKMKVTYRITAFAAFSVVLHGCSVTPVAPEAQNVKVISEQQAKSCRFLDSVSTNNTNTLSEDSEKDARNRAFNRVAELGGNALRIVSKNSQISRSGIGSYFTLNGEAYACK